MMKDHKMYTRTESRSKLITSGIFLAFALWCVISAMIGEFFLFDLLKDLFSWHGNGQLMGGTRTLLALMGVFFLAFGGVAAYVPIQAIRYMDIHQVNAVSGKDLKEWLGQK